MIYTRWKKGETRRGSVFAQLTTDHPAAGWPCPECLQPLGTGKPVQLIAVRPDDDYEKLRHNQGRWHNCGAAVLHQSCADRCSDARIEKLVGELTVVDLEETHA